MTQQSFYNCSFFNNKIDNFNSFSVEQEEIVLKKMISKEKLEFEIKKVEYKCKFIQHKKFDISKPLAIIPIKDNVSLLEFTIKNIINYKILDSLDFIVVDDRSDEDIYSLCKQNSINYLRVDNDKGFNFSMLNNIAAKLAYENGYDTIVLWNSDLWANDESTIPELVKLHKENNSTISGTKLLYPNFSWDGKEVSHNIETIFPNKKNNYRGTIQFGGSAFIIASVFNTYFPIHSFRFKEKDYYRANVNKICEFVTGAFQIINLKWFIELGGLNPSLSKNFQDVDICLKATEDNKKVMYFGKDLFLLHDESVLLSKNKTDQQFISDNALYSRIWNNHRFLKMIVE